MLDDERLKALDLVAKARDAVDQGLSSAKNREEAKPLEELQNCLEVIEGDLVITALDQHIAELQASQEKLIAINKQIETQAGDLKSIAKKVATAAKAISIVIDVASKVVTAV
jgi:chromosome segregation ATPase